MGVRWPQRGGDSQREGQWTEDGRSGTETEMVGSEYRSRRLPGQRTLSPSPDCVHLRVLCEQPWCLGCLCGDKVAGVG